MRVSIITVTYNVEKLLEKTILSVLNQTCKDFEYIIVDGASTDKTIEIIERYELRIKNGNFHGITPEQFRWISEPDQGLYDAMNKGMDLATGNFVWFINAGDLIFDEYTLQNIKNAYSNAPASDTIYGQCLFIDKQGNTIGEWNKTIPEHLTKNSLLYGLRVCHQSLLVKMTIAPQYNLKYEICADYDWLIRVLENSKLNSFVNQYFSKFLIAGISSQKRTKAWRERFFIMKKAFGLSKTLLSHFIIILKYPFTRKY